MIDYQGLSLGSDIKIGSNTIYRFEQLQVKTFFSQNNPDPHGLFLQSSHVGVSSLNGSSV